MDRKGIIILVVLIIILVGYLAVKRGASHTLREGLSGWWNIKNKQDCIEAGGSSYAECAADGTQYCAGPCTGPGHKCGGLEWNACINPGAPSSGLKANNPYATASTMTCPPEYPYLLEYANGDKWCYENSDGNTTGEGGLCNCDCQDCGFNSSFPNCAELGDQYRCETCNYLFEKGPTA